MGLAEKQNRRRKQRGAFAAGGYDAGAFELHADDAAVYCAEPDCTESDGHCGDCGRRRRKLPWRRRHERKRIHGCAVAGITRSGQRNNCGRERDRPVHQRGGGLAGSTCKPRTRHRRSTGRCRKADAWRRWRHDNKRRSRTCTGSGPVCQCVRRDRFGGAAGGGGDRVHCGGGEHTGRPPGRYTRHHWECVWRERRCGV